jgi:hypothetical protein
MRQRKRTSGFLIGGALTRIERIGSGGLTRKARVLAALVLRVVERLWAAVRTPVTRQLRLPPPETRRPRQAILPRARRDRLRLALPAIRAVAQR